MVADAVATLRRLDALVCLAGGYSSAKLEELSWRTSRSTRDKLRPDGRVRPGALPELRQSEAGAIVTIGARPR